VARKFVASSRLTNALITSITRPDRAGPGGDVQGSPLEVLPGSSILAIYEPRNQLVKLSDERIERVDARFSVDLTDDDGNAIDVEVGDLITWAFRDDSGSGSGGEVVTKSVFRSPGFKSVNHIELLTKG